jgi:hypothetical protein
LYNKNGNVIDITMIRGEKTDKYNEFLNRSKEELS